MEGDNCLRFTILFGFLITSIQCTCKSDFDCPNLRKQVYHCCRDFDMNSNLSCHDSSCYGHFCKADTECGQLCCNYNKCKKCRSCVLGNDTCDEGKFCCPKDTSDVRGKCRNTCIGSKCTYNSECIDPQLCCSDSGICVNTGCTKEHPNVAITLVVSGATFIFILLLSVFVILKLKRITKRRRRVVPVNLQMYETGLTMRTTYPVTNNRTQTTSSENG